jgi:sporulation protein YlmC with PRC-barrel domain
MEAAEKLGRIDRIFLDTQARKIAGFRVSRGGALTVSLDPKMVPASLIHAIGPDAVTVRHLDTEVEDGARLDGMPRVSDFFGRTVVSQNGQVLGVIDDVLISGADIRIIGFALADQNVLVNLGRLLAITKPGHIRYIRAEADLRAGRELMIAPEEALGHWELEDSSAPPAVPAAADRGRAAGSAFPGDLVERRPGPQ